ncbi:hypothetical protein Har1130_17105 [Haloarcula sp. CBA1130]|uniref:hypothetical protein n=1 Tax=unclassified Haloarcula TaxID=2624677 RepID=UPI001245D0C6|nr:MULTISPECIES: hypothetical protein [unclassified Haloarcula]KAA9396018.1 hypothetical protein Har1129_19135 [Haloarcula sp. CBA1129]KAA9400451.1 hypothetical protein Har1130_17105 [Haloarcula sp. CBA1130]
MKRRTLLGGALPLLGVGRWVDQLLFANRGEIVQKRLIGTVAGEATELVVIDSDGAAVAAEHEEVLGQSPGGVPAGTANALRERYDSLRFQLTVSHHDDGPAMLGRTGTTEYRTSRTLYSGTTVGDHISFQTSLLERETIISLSCLASDEESLQRRCRVDIDDPTGER